MKLKFGFITGIVFMFLLSGCLTTNVGERVKLESNAEDILEGQCNEIKGIGDVQSLIYKVNINTEEILKLSSMVNPSSQLARITFLGDEISVLVDRIKLLIKREWTDLSVDFKSQWKLGLKDFGMIEGAWPVKLNFNRVKVRSVIVNGREQDYLKNQVVFSEKGNVLNVTLNRKASVLEACSLSQTLAVILDVRYNAGKTVPISGDFPADNLGYYRSFKLVLEK